MEPLDQQKRALRALVRARMPAPGSAEHAFASTAAQERLLRSDPVAAARVIALYRAFPAECSTSLLASALREAGKRVCYPVVQPDARALSFRNGDGVFVAGARGVEEPTGEPVGLDEIDLLVVPAVAVDERGGRLGRGKGHYDATLALCGAHAIALVFESQLVPEVPVGEHDHRVAGVCTEARLIRVPAR
jgi:5-formyltetrahydrofolate cyclo-ligase